MAYVELRRGADGGDQPWLEGRRLEHGDPIWVPEHTGATGFVGAWSAAVFMEVNPGAGTLTVAYGERKQELSLRTGLRRRHV